MVLKLKVKENNQYFQFWCLKSGWKFRKEEAAVSSIGSSIYCFSWEHYKSFEWFRSKRQTSIWCCPYFFYYTLVAAYVSFWRKILDFWRTLVMICNRCETGDSEWDIFIQDFEMFEEIRWIKFRLSWFVWIMLQDLRFENWLI